LVHSRCAPEAVDEMGCMDKIPLARNYPINPKSNSKFEPSNCDDNEEKQER